MDDSLRMRRTERFGSLSREFKRFIQRQTAAGNTFGECFAVDELECQGTYTVLFLEPIDCGNARMIQRREQLRFAMKSCDAFVVVRKVLRHRTAGSNSTASLNTFSISGQILC